MFERRSPINRPGFLDRTGLEQPFYKIVRFELPLKSCVRHHQFTKNVVFVNLPHLGTPWLKTTIVWTAPKNVSHNTIIRQDEILCHIAQSLLHL